MYIYTYLHVFVLFGCVFVCRGSARWRPGAVVGVLEAVARVDAGEEVRQEQVKEAAFLIVARPE